MIEYILLIGRIISLIVLLIGLSVLVITLSSLNAYSYVTDYHGNSHRGMIRWAQNVPNNGLLYRYMHRRRDEITMDERCDWILDNQELYRDIMAQKSSRPPYDDVKIKVKYF